MDWLDWVMAVSGGLAVFSLLAKALRGIDLLQSHLKKRLIDRIGVVAVFVVLISAAIDAIYPVRTVLCLVNGDQRAQQITVEQRSICLQPLSYAVLRWRRPPVGETRIVSDQRDTPVSATLAAGVWVVNLSARKIQADFVDPDNFAPISGVFERGQVIRAPVEQGRIYRILSEASLDRIYSGNGDIHPTEARQGCRAERAKSALETIGVTG